MRTDGWGLAALALGLGGCLDPILEGPYLLRTGLGACDSVAPTGRERMLVGCTSGTWELDGTGAGIQVDPRPTRAVSAHGDRIYMADAEGVRWRPVRGADGSAGALKIPGVVDVQAWYDDQVLIATGTGIAVWTRGRDVATPWRHLSAPPRAIGMGPLGLGRTVLVVTEHAVFAMDQSRSWPLVEGLDQPRAAMVDADDQVWVIHGEPPVLARVDDGQATTIARYLDDPQDVVAGDGGYLHRKNAYMADGTGTVDYVRMP